MRIQLALWLALLLTFSTVQAQPSGDSNPVNQTVEQGKSFLDKTLEGVGDAASGIGDAAQKTGDGVEQGASAVGRFVTAVGKAVANGIAATGQALGTGAAAIGQGVASIATLTAQGTRAIGLGSSLAVAGATLAVSAFVLDASSALGALAGAAAAQSGLAIAFASQAIAGVLRDGALAYIGLIGHLRPDAVPVVVFGTVAVTGAAASTGAGGWAGWAALKKWGWLSSTGIAGFSRIADDELLEHPLRSQIFQVIQTNPGIHASGLARQVGVGWGTITHHLEKLEKGQLVATRKINNQKCFFEQGGKVSRLDMAVAGAVKGDTAGDIAGFVMGHPMTSQKDMAEALSLSPALVSFHVKKLVNLGVLDKVRHGKETLLTTSEALRRVLAAESSPVVHAELKDESFSYTS